MCGFWVALQTVRYSRPASYWATTPRGSIAFGARRWFSIRWLTTTSASAKAASTALSSSGWPLSGVHPRAAPDVVDDDVALEGLVQEGRAVLHRRLRVDHGGQFLVLDRDRVGGVAREVAVGGDDDGHGLAHVAHLVGGDGVVVGSGEGGADGHGAEVFGQLRARDHEFDALHGRRLARIDGADDAVGDVAALEGEVQHARQLDVIDVDGLPLDEARVLAALHALADELGENGCVRAGHGAILSAAC